MAKRKKFFIYMNAPLTMSFVLICLTAPALDFLTAGKSTVLVFST